jgi:hypothetical protein
MPHFSHPFSNQRRKTLRLTGRYTGLGLLVSLAGGVASMLSAPTAQAAQSRYRISTAALEQAVAQRFPVRYPVGQLLNVDLQAAHLRMLTSSNRIAANIDLEASGPALNRNHTGNLDIEFALRYEASDHSLRAHQIQVHSLKLAGLSAQAQGLLNVYAPRLGEKAMAEVVLHRLPPAQATMLDSLGLQPEKITVTDQGLEVTLALGLAGFDSDPTP